MLARRRDQRAAVLACPGEQGASDRLRARTHFSAVTRGDAGGLPGPRAVVASRPAGQRLRPGACALYGALRGNAISVLGTKLGRFWFDFQTPRIKVPYTRELSPLAGDVDSNGNVVYMVDFGRGSANSLDYVA
jgi:hypothetical protein